MPPKTRQKTSKSESKAKSSAKLSGTGAKPVKAAQPKPPKSSPESKPKSKPKAKAKASAGPDRVNSAGISEGQKAPDFRVARDGGATVSLAEFAGKNLVIFFYPRADTPGCTLEARDFTRLASSFAKLNTGLLGVSADPLKAQERFRDKHRLSVPLGADEQMTMLNAYGAWGEKSMYGRTFLGVLRTTFLIDTRGKIVKIWHGVKVDGHAREVLSSVKALAG